MRENIPIGTIELVGNQNDEEIKTLLKSILNEQKKSNQLLVQMSNTNPDQEMLNHDEAAEFLGISRATLYNLCSQEKIPRYKVGSKNLFKRSDLKQWIEVQSVKQIKPSIP
jgi:excisionase family DNA binding protein